jgi:hypothetical protein
MSERRINVQLRLDDFYVPTMTRIARAVTSFDRIMSQQSHPIDRVENGDDGPQVWPGDQS